MTAHSEVSFFFGFQYYFRAFFSVNLLTVVAFEIATVFIMSERTGAAVFD